MKKIIILTAVLLCITSAYINAQTTTDTKVTVSYDTINNTKVNANLHPLTRAGITIGPQFIGDYVGFGADFFFSQPVIENFCFSLSIGYNAVTTQLKKNFNLEEKHNIKGYLETTKHTIPVTIGANYVFSAAGIRPYALAELG